MIGGGVLAYTLLGIDYNELTGACSFLVQHDMQHPLPCVLPLALTAMCIEVFDMSYHENVSCVKQGHSHSARYSFASIAAIALDAQQLQYMAEVGHAWVHADTGPPLDGAR